MFNRKIKSDFKLQNVFKVFNEINRLCVYFKKQLKYFLNKYFRFLRSMHF